MTDPRQTLGSRHSELESRVAALEVACASSWPVDVARFAPPPDHPDHLDILCELVRVHLEAGWERGAPTPLGEYRALFPTLFACPDRAAAVTFDNDRLRGRFSPRTEVVDSSADRSWRATLLPSRRTGRVACSTPLRSDNPVRLTAPTPALPKAGDLFLGFRLIEELGAGSFGCVYLAHQQALSDRPVALKLTTRASGEAQYLARLQHTNIMPVLSVHTAGDVHAVCMPYCGRITLGQVIRTLHQGNGVPASGHRLVSELRGADPTLKYHSESSSVPADPIAHLEPGSATPVRDMLSKMRYSDAVGWIGARLADGLAHAHDRGILHRDLKPDNVLLADDGQPMLLDFNLADDVGPSADGRREMGGTILYMAPEHLAAFTGAAGARVDARSDVYALGLILYELLAGRHPFPLPGGGLSLSSLVKATRTARSRPPECVRRWNPSVPADVAAVIARMLAPDPDERYQSARQVEEDLDRHLAQLPLRHAREPVRSRVVKWSWRNPGAVPFIALLLALGMAVGLTAFVMGERRASEIEHAARVRDEFRDDLRVAQVLLAAQTGDPANRSTGAERLRAALARYAAADNPDWATSPLVLRLPRAEQTGLRADVGEALLLLARATAADDPTAALRLNRLAEGQFPPGRVPPAVWRQRAELCDRVGDAAEAGDARRRAGEPAEPSAQAAYLDGADLAVSGQFAEAVPPLEQACRLDPAHPAATFTLGFCLDALGRDAEALECYRACIALRPSFPWPYLNRGLVYMRRRDDARAMADLDAAVRLKPDWADAVFTRGTLHQRAGRWPEAVADYDRAEHLGCVRARLFLLRGTAKKALGDPTAADDRAAGFAAKATDEHDFLARGVARLPQDPVGAVAEFDRALTLNPRSLAALQNKSHVLAEHLFDTAGAVAVLDEAVDAYPAYVPARAGRGVLLARLGKRDLAQRDAAECLRRDTSPVTLYQLAGVYAHTARNHSDDLREAVRLLGAAFTAGFRDFATLDADPDLDPIRDRPEFSAVVREFRPTDAGSEE